MKKLLVIGFITGLLLTGCVQKQKPPHVNPPVLTPSINPMPSSQEIKLSGNETKTITGNSLVLSRIEVSGNTVLHVYWINSSNLRVIAKDHAKVFLAGIVTDLDIIASGDADVDARYLRAENSYVSTSNDADVGVTVKNALSSISTDRSTIYYYKDSDAGMHYLDHSGSALRMTGIPDHRN